MHGTKDLLFGAILPDRTHYVLLRSYYHKHLTMVHTGKLDGSPSTGRWEVSQKAETLTTLRDNTGVVTIDTPEGTLEFQVPLQSGDNIVTAQWGTKELIALPRSEYAIYDGLVGGVIAIKPVPVPLDQDAVMRSAIEAAQAAGTTPIETLHAAGYSIVRTRKK